MSDFEDTVLQALSRLENGQVNLQKDVTKLQEDVGGLQEDVGGLQEEVGGLQEGQLQLQKDVRRLEVLQEHTEEKIDQIIEAVSPEMQKNNEQDTRLDDHETRIQKLELTA